MGGTEDLAEDVGNVMASAPSLLDYDSDERVKLMLRIFNHPRRDEKGLAVQAIWGGDVINQIVDEVEPMVDMRKAKKGTTDIGEVIIRGDGEVEDWSIEEEYLKPSTSE